MLLAFIIYWRACFSIFPQQFSHFFLVPLSHRLNLNILRQILPVYLLVIIYTFNDRLTAMILLLLRWWVLDVAVHLRSICWIKLLNMLLTAGVNANFFNSIAAAFNGGRQFLFGFYGREKWLVVLLLVVSEFVAIGLLLQWSLLLIHRCLLLDFALPLNHYYRRINCVISNLLLKISPAKVLWHVELTLNFHFI